MLRTILAAALVAATAGVPAAPAAASHHAADCAYHTEEREGTTRGVAYGYVAGDADDVVSVSCVIEVSGEPVAATPATPGTGVAVTYAPLEFALGPDDPVQYCTVTTVNRVTDRACYHVDYTQVPPPWVIDLLIPVAEEVDRALAPVWDALIWHDPGPDQKVCPLLQTLAGPYGPVVVNSQGDVFLDGEPFWDCPPYDLFGS